MRIAGIACAFFFLTMPASAIITLGLSNENFTLTGIGANSSGQGQSKMGWGACSFDSVTTTCSVTGPYTGLGAGGTYSFVVSYTGNGPFPINAITNPGSDFFFALFTSNLTFSITLNQNSGSPISFYDFANFSFLYSSPTCTGIPAASCSVGNVGQTPNATITGHITGTFDPTPMIRPSAGVITASGYGGFSSIAPSTWIEIYGTNLGNVRSQIWASADFKGTQAPSALASTTVTVAGQPAYILYVTPDQVNVQVPSGIPTGPQDVVVTTAGGTSAPYSINVNTAEPGLLAIPSFILNGHQNVVALFSNTLTYVYPVSIPGASTSRAKAGDNITLYGIGFGPVTPVIPAGQVVTQANALNAQIQITFGGVPATVTYSGLGPSNVGLYQFNVVVPKVAASDTVPVAFTLGGVPSTQNLVIAIGN